MEDAHAFTHLSGTMPFCLLRLLLILFFPLATTFEEHNRLHQCLELTGAQTVFPGNPAYHSARRLYSKFWQAWPAAVSYPKTEAQVAAVVACAHRLCVPLTVRGGGHSNAGASVGHGAVVLDLTALNGVTLSPDGSRLRVQGGALVGRVLQQLWLQSNGTRSVPLGQMPVIGIGGLALGGGWGFTTKAHGLLADQLLALRAVTGRGRVVAADATENADLLWASRGGGGGNFAVVTEFTFRTFAVPGIVTKVQAPLPLTLETLRAYLHWSPLMDPRVTLNLAVYNRTHAMVEGALPPSLFGSSSGLLLSPASLLSLSSLNVPAMSPLPPLLPAPADPLPRYPPHPHGTTPSALTRLPQGAFPVPLASARWHTDASALCRPGGSRYPQQKYLDGLAVLFSLREMSHCWAAFWSHSGGRKPFKGWGALAKGREGGQWVGAGLLPALARHPALLRGQGRGVPWLDWGCTTAKGNLAVVLPLELLREEDVGALLRVSMCVCAFVVGCLCQWGTFVVWSSRFVHC